MTSMLHDAPAVNPTLPEPADTRDHAEPFAPTAYDEAYHLGALLFEAGEDPHPPIGWDFERLIAFYSGFHEARTESLEFEMWLDARDAERMEEVFGGADRHEAEVIEAVGCIEARKA